MKWIFYIVLLIVAGNIIIELIGRAALASNPDLLKRVLDQQDADNEAREYMLRKTINQ